MNVTLEEQTPGYLCGRLFAVIEHVLEEAGSDWQLHSKFEMATHHPAAGIVPLMTEFQRCLAGLKRGHRDHLNPLVGEVTASLTEIPQLLSLPEQGHFTLGYLHQASALQPMRQS